MIDGGTDRVSVLPKQLSQVGYQGIEAVRCVTPRGEPADSGRRDNSRWWEWTPSVARAAHMARPSVAPGGWVWWSERGWVEDVGARHWRRSLLVCTARRRLPRLAFLFGGFLERRGTMIGTTGH